MRKYEIEYREIIRRLSKVISRNLRDLTLDKTMVISIYLNFFWCFLLILQKHQKKFIEGQVSKIPRNYLTKPSNDFTILNFIFPHIDGFIILVITSKFAIFPYYETY